MRLTIVPGDGFVSVDCVGFDGLDLSFLPAEIHAVQWYETYGEIEVKDMQSQKTIDNVAITSIEPYQNAIDLWTAAKAKAETPIYSPSTASENQPEVTGAQTL